jgi:hypothetical protein
MRWNIQDILSCDIIKKTWEPFINRGSQSRKKEKKIKDIKFFFKTSISNKETFLSKALKSYLSTLEV